MTAAKNVYALMLALVIVLSGCFGNTSDGVDADDDDGFDEDDIEMIAIGGILNHPGAPPYWVTAYTMNITAGQMIQVHEGNADHWMSFETTCANGAEFTTAITYSGNYMVVLPRYIAGAAFDCTHDVVVYHSSSTAVNISWSLVYSIVPVTVG